jgi:hypothetical protein
MVRAFEAGLEKPLSPLRTDFIHPPFPRVQPLSRRQAERADLRALALGVGVFCGIADHVRQSLRERCHRPKDCALPFVVKTTRHY